MLFRSNDTATTEIYTEENTLSLHDALPICVVGLNAPRLRMAAAAAAIAALLLAPSVWAVDTLGHASSGTFPKGGPANMQTAGGGRFGGFGGRPGATGDAGGVQLFGAGAAQASGPPSGSGAVPGGPSATGGTGGGGTGLPPGIAGGAGAGGFARAGFGAGAAGGGFGGDRSLTQVLAYVKRHGGGTIAISSQSSAASSIIASNADVAGIGGFSGRESDISVSWLAQEVSSGAIRWVLGEQTGAQGAGPSLPGDTRAGSKAAMTAVAKACRKVTLSTSVSTSASTGATGGVTGASGAAGTSSSTLYYCQGQAAALQSAAG